MRYSFYILIMLLQFTVLKSWAQPKANFSPSAVSGCSPFSVTFTDVTTGGTSPYTYVWKLGNSNTSFSKNPSAIYYLPGKYNITQIVTDAAGKSDSITKSITVLKNPTAKLSSVIQAGCAPFKANFLNLSTPGSSKITKWLWDFGDGTTSSVDSPGYHTYINPGKYTVSLEVTDSGGCTSFISLSSYIFVSSPPTIKFSGSSLIACAPPFNVNFTSSVTASGTVSYLWDFGDGSTATTANPSHSYSSDGIYSVKLTVIDSLGCIVSQENPNYIYVGNPKASFNYSVAGGCAPLAVTFASTSSGAPAGSSFFWKFGDGQSGTGSPVTHVYAPGSYGVKLVVVSPAGCSDTFFAPDIIHVSYPYKPTFTFDTLICSTPATDFFMNTTPHAKVISWYFGSGKPTYTTHDTITNIFNDTAGVYTVALKVVDANGCIETDSEKNAVHFSQTIAKFSMDTNGGCIPFTVKFKDSSSSTDSITSVLWGFGDGTTSKLYSPPPHVYTGWGTFYIKLLIQTKNHCASEFVDSIMTGIRPHPKFTSSPDSGCLNMLRHVHFINLSDTNAPFGEDGYMWIFGAHHVIHKDPMDSNNVYVSFNDKPGRYDVSLVDINDGACADTFSVKKLITIAPPWAEYNPYNDTCSKQNIVHFYDASIGASRVEYYFGDGDSSSQRNPVHAYLDTGLVYPYEVVFDSSNGCSDTFSFYNTGQLKGLYIKPPWRISVDNITSTYGCSPFRARFVINSNDSSYNVLSYGDGHDTLEALTGITGFSALTAVHIYSKPGIYKISMVSTNNSGCRKYFNLTKEIIVVGMKPGFFVSNTKGCIPLTVTLTDTSSSDSTFIRKVYDMGDGSTIKITSKTMQYTYKKPPADQTKGFQIRQIVNNGYCTDTAKYTVYPYQPQGQIFQFNLSNCDSVAYQFIHQATGFSPFKYLWIFGKGDTSLATQPIRTYKTGAYNVKLKVTDSLGCIDTVSLPINVASVKDSANFSVSLSQTKCPPVTANFTDLSKFSIPGSHKWFWDFGDGSFSTLQNPSKVYDAAGSYNVTLKITDALGCTSTITKINLVNIKGATGEYSFTPKTGCTPLKVHFTAVSPNASQFEWDFGDGNVSSSDTATHVYTNAGSFVPLLILGDKTGCLYTLPPKDTITVNPAPVPAFGYDSTCSGQSITFTDRSTTLQGAIVGWAWDFGDGSNPDYRQSPTHVYNKAGFYPVKLKVTNNSGCSASVYKSVKYGDIIAGIKVGKTGCLGSEVQFTDKTLSDGPIKSWYWDFGDGGSSNQQNPVHVYTQKGVFPISLYVSNFRGCFDSLNKGAYLIVGDTVPPPSPMIYRATVADDHTIELDYGMNRSYDFKKYLIFIRDETGNIKLMDSVFDPKDTILMERGLNNLHHSYCLLVRSVNVCGYQSDSGSSSWHCTINLDAKPGVNEALLSWTPYIGWPVAMYKIYRQGLETPPQFNILDSVPGSQLKYIDTSVVCYRKMVYRVEGLEQGGNRQVSWSDTAATVPIHVAHVPAGDMVRATVENNKSTLVEWSPVARGHVKEWMLEKSEDGINFQQLDTPISPVIFSEADQKVNVQTTSYTYRLRILDSCGDLGPYSNIGKTILLGIDTDLNSKPDLVWSAYRDWPEGVQYYDIDIENGDKNFVWLARTASGQDTEFVDNITDLNSLPFYTYHVVAHRNGTLADPNKNLLITSTSNDATLKPHSRLFIPNAFTPNGDGINDSFFVQGMYIKSFHIKIFDRWGTKVFESGSMKDKWDGRFKDGAPMMDAYKYLIYYEGVDNIDRYVVGWVTLLQ